MNLTENEIASLMGNGTATLEASPFSETGSFDAASLDFAVAKIAERESELPVAHRVACPMCNAATGDACYGPKTHQTRKVLAGRAALRPLHRS